MPSSNESSIGFEPRLLINGELVAASDGKTFEVFNPSTTGKLADIPEATEDDANRAVAAAKAAFPAWSELSPEARGVYLKKYAAALREHADAMNVLEARTMGKPVWLSVDAAAEFEYYAEAWPQIQGTSSLNKPGQLSVTLRQPFGVVAGIVPWNLPIIFFANKAAAPLIAGNTVVIKSSEKAPLALARAAALAADIFPPGVLNVLHGHGTPAGAVLAAHMDVRVLSFTGSSRTGQAIQVAAARSNLKRVLLELGGKSPALVFADADLAKAARLAATSIRINSGQVCMANSRVYVEKSIAGPFVDEFKKHFAFGGGDPTQPTTVQGPQADAVQYKNVLNYIEEGKKAGATLALGGNGKLESLNGYFVEPTIFLNSPENSKIMKEEIFGPVVSINVFETEEEAIRLANDTEFGLYAAVFTNDVKRAIRVAKALESGTVGVNTTSPALAPDMPFGGYKMSGQGREGRVSSLDNFLEVKTVTFDIST